MGQNEGKQKFKDQNVNNQKMTRCQLKSGHKLNHTLRNAWDDWRKRMNKRGQDKRKMKLEDQNEDM